ncbi:MAG: hypothetical protein V1806_16305 [Pseudomonadota bacterium]
MSNKQNDHFDETAKETEEEQSQISALNFPLKADIIVSNIKDMTKTIDFYLTKRNIDFLGCSSLYCIEKVCHLEVVLKYLKKHLNSVDNKNNQLNKKIWIK